MVFSDTSTKLGIIQDITFLTGVDTSSYELPDRTRNVNERYNMVWDMIFESYGGWKWMDDNTSDTSTGVPYADQTVTSGQNLYALPASALTVDSVWIKNTASGSWNKLIPITQEEYDRRGGDGGIGSGNGTPSMYMLQGDILRLVTTPNFTLAAALRVYFGAGTSAFAASDTTKTPGFASTFHRMLSIGGSIDWLLVRGPADRLATCQALWTDYERRLRLFYAKRWKDRFPANVNPGPDLLVEFS